MKKTIITILILLLFLTACEPQETEPVKTECDKIAEELKVEGDYYCEWRDGKYVMLIKKNEMNKRICDLYPEAKDCD